MENKKNLKKELYCECGRKLEPNWHYCPHCQRPISNYAIEKENNADWYIWFFCLSLAVGFFLDFELAFFIGFIIILTGRINCPKNDTIKIIFLIVISLLVIGIVSHFLIQDFITSCTG